MNSLLEIDKEILLFLNGMHSPLMDEIMWFFSRIPVWIPLYVLLIVFIILTFKKKSWLIILFVVLLIACSDQTSVHLFKNVFHRLRPSHEPSLQGLLHFVHNYHGGLYGFISSHASNTFALATFLSLLFRRKWFSWAILIWAGIVSYSRIYLGVHYPGDVVCGALWGVLLAFAFFALYRKFVYIVYRNNTARDAGH